jgi:hypothetical protein
MVGSSPVPLRRWLAPIAALLRRRQSAADPASPPGPPPMPRSEILARYRRLRQISKRQHEAVLDIIAPSVLLDWARRLDLTEGKAIVLENDNEMRASCKTLVRECQVCRFGRRRIGDLG